MTGTTCLTVLAGLSGLVVFGALFSVAHIYNDINSFVDSAHRELGDFKGFANDAWNSMVNHEDSARVARSVFGRRHKKHSQCNCGPQASNCPAGPPGPPGAP
ncbi:hypothetical protein CRE_02195, partial [Caenorhabditis remanei]